MENSNNVVDLPVLDNPPMPHVMNTPTGRVVNLVHPDPRSICIDDIAQGLADLALYEEHIEPPSIYSVAIRACWVARYLSRRTSDPEIALHGLLYNAEQAYLKTINPSKNPVLLQTQRKLKAAIYHALNMPPLHDNQLTLIKLAYEQVRTVELVSLLPKGFVQKRDLATKLDECAFANPWLEPVLPWIVTAAYLQFFNNLKRGEQV